MSSWISKITYNELGTGTPKEIEFDSPPEGDPFNEERKATAKTKRSSNGTPQTQFNYIQQIFNLEFTYQSSTVYEAFLEFFDNHASQGGFFEYHSSTEESSLGTYEFENKNTKYKRPIFAEVGTFEFNWKFKISTVLDLTYEVEESGVGAIQETQATIANNQVAAADVVGLAFDGSEVRGARINYSIYRNTTGGSAEELSETGTLRVSFLTVADDWEEPAHDSVGNAGVTFSITSAGQLQYTSTNMAGDNYVGTIRFEASTIAIEV